MLSKPGPADTAAGLIDLTRDAMRAADAVLHDATAAVRARLGGGGKAADGQFDREQRATHGLAWLATYVEAVRQLSAYAERMHDAGSLGEIEDCSIEIGIGEYLAQIIGGIPMSQGEIVRPADLGPRPRRVAGAGRPAAATHDRRRASAAARGWSS